MAELSLPSVTTPELVTLLEHEDQASGIRGSERGRLTNLPVQLTTFVGRTRELAELNRILDENRLVTLTGPGGVGKTRLGFQLAADRVGSFPDGVWLVQVAELSFTTELEQAVARAVRVEESIERDSRAALRDWLNNRELLILFDDCEKLVEIVAEMSADILQHAGGVKILTTSRAPTRRTGRTPLDSPFAHPS